MLDRSTATEVQGFSIVVHREVPDYWPSAADGTDHTKRHVFQTREFIEAWMATRGVSSAVGAYFVEVRDTENQPLLLLPLTVTSSRGARTLGFMDAGLADYNAPVLFVRPVQWTAENAGELWEKVLAALPAVDLIQMVGKYMFSGGGASSAPAGNATPEPAPADPQTPTEHPQGSPQP